jgi:hypothetical protein
MSIENKADSICPGCGKKFKTTIWSSLNSDVNSLETERLLSGKLFEITCPKCKETYSIVYPILYHDMANHVMIFLSLNENDEQNFIYET